MPAPKAKMPRMLSQAFLSARTVDFCNAARLQVSALLECIKKKCTDQLIPAVSVRKNTSISPREGPGLPYDWRKFSPGPYSQCNPCNSPFTSSELNFSLSVRFVCSSSPSSAPTLLPSIILLSITAFLTHPPVLFKSTAYLSCRSRCVSARHPPSQQQHH